jgi:RNA polymerase-binding transcription factor DksA
MTASAEPLRAREASARARLAHLDAQLDGLRRDRAAESADDEHDPEGGTLSAEWSRLEGLRGGILAELADIDTALARVADGTYGVCAVCGTAIPAARLEARPTATRCVTCAASGR